MNKESVESQKMSWKGLWRQPRLMPSKEQPVMCCHYPKTSISSQMKPYTVCHLCSNTAKLTHILTRWKVLPKVNTLRWHNQVLKCLAAEIESKKTAINYLPVRRWRTMHKIAFEREGEQSRKDISPAISQRQLAETIRLENESMTWTSRTNNPTRDYQHQPKAGPGVLLQHSLGCLLCRAHRIMGTCSGQGI